MDLKDYHCDNPFCFTQYSDYTKRRLQLKFKQNEKTNRKS